MIQTWSWKHAIIKSDLPSTTRHVLLTLACHMNDCGESCFPSIEMLQSETGLSNRAICTHLSNAKTSGWLNVKKHGFAGKKWARNEYKASYPQGYPQAKGSERDSLRNCEGSEPNDVKAVNEVHTNSTLNSSIEDICLKDGFEEYWIAFADKRGKDAALKVWKRKKLHAIKEEVINGATMYAATRSGEKRYWKMPQGWLNDGRWKDDHKQMLKDNNERSVSHEKNINGSQRPSKSDRAKQALMRGRSTIEGQ